MVFYWFLPLICTLKEVALFMLNKKNFIAFVFCPNITVTPTNKLFSVLSLEKEREGGAWCFPYSFLGSHDEQLL